MKIKINDCTALCFPMWLTAGFIRRKLQKEGIKLTRKQTALLIKEIKRYKKNHSEWNLIEVDEKNGNTVKIKI